MKQYLWYRSILNRTVYNYNKVVILQDIQKFIDGSPHGVIYFTFGSVVAMSTLPDHIQNAFKNVFRRLPQSVLWKFEGEMENKPDNVMTGNWFPQRDVLRKCFMHYIYNYYDTINDFKTFEFELSKFYVEIKNRHCS